MTIRLSTSARVITCVVALLPGRVTGQSPQIASATTEPTLVPAGMTLIGPQPPAPPAIMARDTAGRMTIRATHVPHGLEIDGRLDEELYQTVPPVSDFIQMEPQPGSPSTERTDVWIAFDADNVYVTARCWDSQPESRWIADDMRRDNGNVVRNENVSFIFDTFYDHRNAVLFEITPIGGIWDGQIENERVTGSDWNPVWKRKTGRFPGGWTAEMAIPFKSLRYRQGATQIWGFNLRRTIRWKNEQAYPMRLPLVAGMSGAAALFQVSNAATVVGIQAPSGNKNLEIKPYALSSVTSDRVARPAISNDLNGHFGVDLKYGVTQNLSANLTYNTDFAQVEVDTQQVNLTRFSLFFPEKREFFLEGQGIFDFGATSSGRRPTSDTTPLLFFSRRIGLVGSRAVPIDVGGRLIGRVGPYTVGAINVQAGDDSVSGTPATNFSVLRLKRNIFRRSSIGVLFTGRSKSSVATGSSETYGVDAALRLHEFVNVNVYVARTSTPGLEGGDTSHRVLVNYNHDRYGLELDQISVGTNFVPDMGYIQRDDYRRTHVVGRFSPRPKSIKSVRKFTYQGAFDYYENGDGRMETRAISAEFGAELQSTDSVSASYDRFYEFLERPFAIAPGISIPVGGYAFEEAQLSLGFGNQRRLSGTLSLARGSFYGGDRTSLSYTTGRLLISNRFAFEPGASINHVDLPQGRFTSTVVSNRVTFTFTPFMFFSGLVQYNSSARAVGSNLRLRWEYQPGSELFVVYTDDLDTQRRGYPDLRNRAFVIKINRLLRL